MHKHTYTGYTGRSRKVIVLAFRSPDTRTRDNTDYVSLGTGPVNNYSDALQVLALAEPPYVYISFFREGDPITGKTAMTVEGVWRYFAKQCSV